MQARTWAISFNTRALRSSGPEALLGLRRSRNFLTHSKLIQKLHSYGIRNTTLRWIHAFLGNRQQKVVIEGEESDPVPVTSESIRRSARPSPFPCLHWRPSPKTLSRGCVSLLAALPFAWLSGIKVTVTFYRGTLAGCGRGIWIWMWLVSLQGLSAYVQRTESWE